MVTQEIDSGTRESKQPWIAPRCKSVGDLTAIVQKGIANGKSHIIAYDQGVLEKKQPGLE